jgi:hypothetical protein
MIEVTRTIAGAAIKQAPETINDLRDMATQRLSV